MFLHTTASRAAVASKIGGQQLIVPTGSKSDVLAYLRDDLGYDHVELIEGTDWDYIAIKTTTSS
jgi:hypothetical protein